MKVNDKDDNRSPGVIATREQKLSCKNYIKTASQTACSQWNTGAFLTIFSRVKLKSFRRKTLGRKCLSLHLSYPALTESHQSTGIHFKDQVFFVPRHFKDLLFGAGQAKKKCVKADFFTFTESVEKHKTLALI